MHLLLLCLGVQCGEWSKRRALEEVGGTGAVELDGKTGRDIEVLR